MEMRPAAINGTLRSPGMGAYLRQASLTTRRHTKASHSCPVPQHTPRPLP